MTAREFVAQLYAQILPLGVPVPWRDMTEARYTERGRYPRAEATVELWDGTLARIAVQGTPDTPAVQWLELPCPFQWGGDHWEWAQKGDGRCH